MYLRSQITRLQGQDQKWGVYIPLALHRISIIILIQVAYIYSALAYPVTLVSSLRSIILTWVKNNFQACIGNTWVKKKLHGKNSHWQNLCGKELGRAVQFWPT